MAKYTILSGAGHIPTKDKDEADIFYRKGFDYELTDEQAKPLLDARQAVREGEAAPGPEFTPLTTPEAPATPVTADIGNSGSEALKVDEDGNPVEAPVAPAEKSDEAPKE